MSTVEEEPLSEADAQRLADLADSLTCDLFVGDEGCVDPTCWHCHSPISPRHLRTLAKNLAIAGALCKAWQLGWRNGSDPRMYSGPPEWEPGCGSEAP